jgi:ankyrin repeat protein
LSKTLPERADLTHLRDEARALLDALQAGDAEAIATAKRHDPSLDPTQAQLADAQRVLAREYGFPSWTALKTKVETPKLLAEFQRLVRAREVEALAQLLEKSNIVRENINAPLFDFDSPALTNAVSHHPTAELLLRHGADPNGRSAWWAGGFSALDFASPEDADFLIGHGARLDVWSAAAQGQVEALREILDAQPDLIDAPGGDGMRPLHFAKTVEVAALLLDRGADPHIKDVDHEGTPAQHQIGRPEIARLILSRGGEWDIFLASALDDVAALEKVLVAEPTAIDSVTGHPPYVTVKSNGGHIYAYTLGNGKSPLQVASEKGSEAAFRLLESKSSPVQRLIAACARGDEATASALVVEHPDLIASLSPHEAQVFPTAAGAGKVKEVEMMLRLGFDPMTPGMDTGTALHQACWFGQAAVVAHLVGVIDLETRDAHHGSTPLGWAAHGAQWCRNPKGDYVRTVEVLLEAGAKIEALANSAGTSILKQAGNREDVKAVLKKYGAK